MVITYLLILCLLATACCALDSRWILLFSDEFEGNSLDTTKWTAREQQGYVSQGELQYYTPGQVSVGNGSLAIRSEPNPSYAGAWKSGWVDTSGKFAVTYGRYEIRAKFPPGQGTWPGIWLLSQTQKCWPVGSEVDIMESLGNHTSKFWATYHYGADCGATTGDQIEFETGADLSAAFHTYILEWIPGQMTWIFDNTTVMVVHNTTLANGGPFDMDLSPHYMILDTAIGGWPGNPDPADTWPQYHYIDYVRIYGWQPCVTGCGHGCCDGISMTCQCDAGYGGTNCEYTLSPQNFTANVTQADANEGMYGNVALNNGQIQLTMATCSASTCTTPVSGGGWYSTDSFGYGNFTFVAKIPKMQGLVLKMAGTHGGGVYSGFQFLFMKSDMIEVQTYEPRSWNDIQLPFNISADFHTYTMVYGRQNFTVYVDNQRILDVPSCSVDLQMSLFYDYEPNYFGNYLGPDGAMVQVSRADWVIEPHKGQCAPLVKPSTPVPSSMPSTKPSTTTPSTAKPTVPATRSPTPPATVDSSAYVLVAPFAFAVFVCVIMTI